MTISAKVIADSTYEGKRVTTLELEYPRLVHSELMTHRCLVGETELDFDLPAGSRNASSTFRKYSMPIEEFYRKWEYGDSLGRSMKHRLNKMRVRMLNEDTNDIEHTTITDVWKVGDKETFKVCAGNYHITGTDDHLVLTVNGWKEIGDLTLDDYLIHAGFGVHEKTDANRLKKIDGKWLQTWNRNILPEISERQGHVCHNCGCSSALEIHHVVPVHQDTSKAFDTENVVAVCNDCHHHVYHKTQGWQASQQLLGKPVRITSVEPKGIRTVYDLSVASKFHNFVANGIVVHNCFSRNAASSRAIPIERMIEQATDNTVIPMWTKNQKGMQGELVKDLHTINSANAWLDYGLKHAVRMVKGLDSLGIHKQNANRYLEAYQHIKVVLTATEFYNFFDLRLEGAAQLEIQGLAAAMYVAINRSEPEELESDDWHLPYAKDVLVLEEAKKVSASCCAQVSYRRNDTSLEKAEDIYKKLTTSEKLHASAFEHQCTPNDGDTQVGNLLGWHQLRHSIEAGLR